MPAEQPIKPLDATLPPDQLAAAAEVRLRVAEAQAKADNLRIQSEAMASVPASVDAAWQGRLATISNAALAEVHSAQEHARAGGFIDGYLQGLADSAEIERPVAYAVGQLDLAAALDRADRARRAEVGRAVAADAGQPSYAELAERRGEHDKAERARALLRERGIA